MKETTYKYYTWTEGKYFRGQQLLSKPQISSLLAVMDKREEAFATIQDYDKNGAVIGCPLYFDVDSDDLIEAHGMMVDIVKQITYHLKVEPLVWFSGGKGFHVVAPIYIRHPRCHEIARMMRDDLGLESDDSVYRTRSMWRCNNTYNKKAMRYKVQVNPTKSLHEMVYHSADRIHDPFKQAEFRDARIETYIERLPEINVQPATMDKDFWGDMSHCMQTLWAMDSPPEGQRHQLAHLMARHCFRSNKSLEEAIALFAGHPFWGAINPRDYEKVISSVYRSGSGMIGCRHGRDGELLRQYCTDICAFNNETNWNKVFKI